MTGLHRGKRCLARILKRLCGRRAQMGQCHWANTAQTVVTVAPQPMRSCGTFNPQVDLHCGAS